jgi:hypothetical protein
MALMHMPEATMREYDRLVFLKNQIRPAGKSSHVQPVPEAPRVEPFPNRELWLRVGAPDTGHHTAPHRLLHNINHGSDYLAIF